MSDNKWADVAPSAPQFLFLFLLLLDHVLEGSGKRMLLVEKVNISFFGGKMVNQREMDRGADEGVPLFNKSFFFAFNF